MGPFLINPSPAAPAAKPSGKPQSKLIKNVPRNDGGGKPLTVETKSVKKNDDGDKPPSKLIKNLPRNDSSGKPPTMEIKNVLRNDGGVVKQYARKAYEDTFSMAVRQGKMTENRK